MSPTAARLLLLVLAVSGWSMAAYLSPRAASALAQERDARAIEGCHVDPAQVVPVPQLGGGTVPRRVARYACPGGSGGIVVFGVARVISATNPRR